MPPGENITVSVYS